MTYEEAIEWIHSIGRFGIKPGLERMEAMMERLGQPHRKLKYVHIGGTNGKGSTASILASILREAGYRVGLYTSPYLVAFNNRIAINGEDISPENLIKHVETVKPIVEEIAEIPELGQPTEFEVVTTLAFNYYATQQPDIVILEVGLGGRLDATNIVCPLASVITNVSFDHTHILGSSVEEIAREKAGIIKESVPVITAADDPAVQKVLYDTVSQKKACLYHVLPENHDADNDADNFTGYGRRRIIPGGQAFSYRGLKQEYSDLFIPLKGDYQLKNAATALTVLEKLEESGFKYSEEILRKGLQKVSWPGRLEVLREKPYIVLDGAHNPKAIEVLSGAVGEHFNYRKLILIAGIMEDKDAREMLRHILPLADILILTRPRIERAADPGTLKSIVNELYNLPVKTELDMEKAIEEAGKKAGKEDLILITGSFYTISEAREILINEKTD